MTKQILVAILAVVSLFISPITINEIFAERGYDELKWQEIFIASSPACSNYDYQMLNLYTEITSTYLELYNVDNSAYDPLCFPYTQYLSEYQRPDDLDLLVIVLDRDLGEEHLHTQKMGGLYTHTGIDKTQNNLIVFCDCPNFYYSDPVWILTHELSHFVLYSLGYDSTIVEDLVHSKDKKYDQCRENYKDSCKPVSFKLRLDNFAYSFSVVPIYEQAKQKVNPNNLPSPILEFTKTITMSWIEKKISDSDFTKILGVVANYMSPSSNDNSQIVYTDEPYEQDKISWKEINLEYTEEQNDFLLNVTQSNVKEEKYYQEPIIGLPVWFTETANGWEDGTVTNVEFMKDIEFLRNEGVLE